MRFICRSRASEGTSAAEDMPLRIALATPELEEVRPLLQDLADGGPSGVDLCIRLDDFDHGILCAGEIMDVLLLYRRAIAAADGIDHAFENLYGLDLLLSARRKT